MSRLFGTAGIRGVTNKEVTPRMALDIGTAYGDLLRTARRKRCDVAIGHDTRFGAEVLARAAASGLAAAGCNAHFYGCVPTGVFSLNIARNNHDGGILITGSHMPPDRIGIIAILDDGACAPFSTTDEIEKRFFDLENRDTVQPEDIGNIIEALHPYELYVSESVQCFDTRAIREKKFKILADPANGAGSYVAKQFFEWFGCDVEMINFDPNPIPGRASEPRAGTVTEAIQKVKELDRDLGLCFDVDADRVLFITAEGIPVSEDTMGALFAREELKPGELCVTPINSSGLIEQVCRSVGAKLEYCPVGQPPTLEAIKKLGAVYSYEESGKYYFARKNMWADGLYAGARLLEIMTRKNCSLADLVATLPQFHQVKHTVHVEDSRKTEVMIAAAELLGKHLTEGRSRDITVDGFKRCYDDDSWLLLRASGTEPLIRVYSDAPTLACSEKRVQQGEQLLQDAISRGTS